MVVSLAGMSCGSHTHAPPTGPAGTWLADTVSDLGPVVARVAGNPIFAEEVRAQAERSGKPPREALAEVVNFHLLAERARERGLAGDVGRAEVPRGLLVQRFVEREFEPSVEESDITDQELRAVYDRFKTRFVHPRIVRVALLSVYPERGLPRDVGYANARTTAQELSDRLSRLPDRSDEALAKLQQEPTFSSRNIGFSRVWQGPDEAFGPLRAAQGAAIARLRKPGDTTPLLEDKGAYHIARYIEETAAKNVAFEQAREEVRREYYPRWRREKFERFARNLVDGHQIERYFERVLGEAPAR